MLPRVEGALLSHFLSSSLFLPRSHSHRLLSSAGPGSTRNRDGADPLDPPPPRHLVGPRPLAQAGQTRASALSECLTQETVPLGRGRGLGSEGEEQLGQVRRRQRRHRPRRVPMYQRWRGPGAVVQQARGRLAWV